MFLNGGARALDSLGPVPLPSAAFHPLPPPPLQPRPPLLYAMPVSLDAVHVADHFRRGGWRGSLPLMNAKVWSAIIGGAGLALFTGLLATGTVGELSYIALLTLLAFVCLVIPAYPRLKELDLRNLKLTLDRIEAVKAEVAEMYGGIEHLRRSSFELDATRTERLGAKGGIVFSPALMRYVSGCVKRERERLARIFVNDKPPAETAEAILDASMDDLVFKWNGPEVPLETPPKSVAERYPDQQADPGKQQ